MAQLLLELPFVPLENGRVRMCTAQARQLHPALLDRLPKVRTFDVWTHVLGNERMAALPQPHLATHRAKPILGC